MREYCTPGSVRGAPGNRCPCLDISISRPPAAPQPSAPLGRHWILGPGRLAKSPGGTDGGNDDPSSGKTVPGSGSTPTFSLALTMQIRLSSGCRMISRSIDN